MDAARAGSQKVVCSAPKPAGRAKNKSNFPAGGHPFNGVEQVGHVARDLAVAAARQQDHRPIVRREPIFFEELGARQRRPYDPSQRMSDERRGDSALLKKLFLERKDTQKPRQRLPHDFHTALPPGPRLRSDQVHHRHSQRVEFLGQAQMEIRRVGQDGQIRPPLFRRAHQLAKLAINTRDVAQHFDDPDHRQRPRIHHRFDASRLHPRPGASEEFGARMPRLQCRHQPRSVEVARSFPRRYQHAHKTSLMGARLQSPDGQDRGISLQRLQRYAAKWKRGVPVPRISLHEIANKSKDFAELGAGHEPISKYPPAVGYAKNLPFGTSTLRFLQ